VQLRPLSSLTFVLRLLPQRASPRLRFKAKPNARCRLSAGSLLQGLILRLSTLTACMHESRLLIGADANSVSAPNRPGHVHVSTSTKERGSIQLLRMQAVKQKAAPPFGLLVM
jgi:hypothetical protein